MSAPRCGVDEPVTTRSGMQSKRLAYLLPSSQRVAERTRRRIGSDVERIGQPASRQNGISKRSANLPGMSTFQVTVLSTPEVKQNTRKGVKLTEMQKLTRQRGACILCKIQQKKCTVSRVGSPCNLCLVKMHIDPHDISMPSCPTTFSAIKAQPETFRMLKKDSLIGLSLYFFGIGDTNLYSPSQAVLMLTGPPGLAGRQFLGSVQKDLDSLCKKKILESLCRRDNFKKLLPVIVALLDLLQTREANATIRSNNVSYLADLAEHFLLQITRRLKTAWTDPSETFNERLRSEANATMSRYFNNRPLLGVMRPAHADYTRFQDVVLGLGGRRPRDVLRDGVWSQLINDIVSSGRSSAQPVDTGRAGNAIAV